MRERRSTTQSLIVPGVPRPIDVSTLVLLATRRGKPIPTALAASLLRELQVSTEITVDRRTEQFLTEVADGGANDDLPSHTHELLVDAVKRTGMDVPHAEAQAEVAALLEAARTGEPVQRPKALTPAERLTGGRGRRA